MVRSLLLIAALLLPLLGAAAPVTAQGLQGLGGEGDEPLEINADEGIEWRRNENQYVARGNARAAQGDTEVFADVLIATYRQNAEGDNEIYQVDAQGNVRIVSPNETVYGDVARYSLDQAVMVIRGDDLRMVTAEEVITARDSLEYWEELRVAVARGNAKVRSADQELRADTLTAYIRDNAQGKQEVYRVNVDGNVQITTPTEHIRARQGVYFVQREFATLTGDVKITREDNQLNGEYAEVDLKTGVSKLLGAPPGQEQPARVRGLLVPRKKPTEGAGQ